MTASLCRKKKPDSIICVPKISFRRLPLDLICCNDANQKQNQPNQGYKKINTMMCALYPFSEALSRECTCTDYY